MDNYYISKIYPDDPRAMKQLLSLLEKEGLHLDQNLDYTAGLFDENHILLATGSCYLKTLRCLAVDSSHQGEGLLNQILSHLIEYQYGRGFVDLFLYTKISAGPFFRDLGFYPILSVENRLVFMENKKDGFNRYLNNLKKESKEIGGRQGAVVINANPFTSGHVHLLETASAACDHLHVFIVSEDCSLIPFSVRERLVKEGSRHLTNLSYHHTGDYLISAATFPSYFLKDSHEANQVQAALDGAIFQGIAAYLSITIRYVGEEPFSRVTGIYNQVLKKQLDWSGISFVEIPRLLKNGQVISASTVRELLRKGDWNGVKDMVPETTLQFFLSKEAEGIKKKLKEASDVKHY